MLARLILFKHSYLFDIKIIGIEYAIIFLI